MKGSTNHGTIGQSIASRLCLYSVQIRKNAGKKNADQNNPECGHFLCSAQLDIQELFVYVEQSILLDRSSLQCHFVQQTPEYFDTGRYREVTN